MADPLSVLVIDSDPARRHAVRELLKDHATARVEAEAGDFETGYQLVNRLRPGIVVLDLGSVADQAFATMERFQVASPQSAIFVSAESQRADTILRAVRAGAQEFFARPVSRKELLAAIQRVARQRALASADTPSRGKLIATFGCKGGRGATVTAMNLAVALARRGSRPVGAVDLDLYTGDLGLYLNLKPSYTVYDAAANVDRMDSLLLKNLLAHHPSGVSLLTAPLKIEEADHVPPLKIAQLLTVLRASFPYVVVDTAPTYEERTFAALDAADEILFVLTPDLASLYHAERCLALFERLAYNPVKIKLVLNRCPAPVRKAVKMAEELLHHPVFWEIPEDEAVPAALVTGEPLVLAPRPSPAAEQLAALASHLDEGEAPDAVPAGSARGLRRLFRGRARLAASQG